MATAAVFPGQGAQSIGMLAALADQYPGVQARFAEASEALGFDVWALVEQGPAQVLSQTENTQPILLTASQAIWDIWQAQENAPDFIAGHSLGEYSALTCAGAIPFVDAVKLVRKRGQLMEAAVPRGQGGMAAILGLDDQQVEACCASVDGVVVAANYNAPGQVAIAGEVAAVTAAVEACKQAGARRAVILDVSGPFHSPLMQAAREDFAEALDQVELVMPKISIVQNVDAKLSADLDTLRKNLLAQLSAPVRWSATVRTLLDLGVTCFSECGPGKVLAGLIRRVSKDTPVHSLATPEGIRTAVA